MHPAIAMAQALTFLGSKEQLCNDQTLENAAGGSGGPWRCLEVPNGPVEPSKWPTVGSKVMHTHIHTYIYMYIYIYTLYYIYIIFHMYILYILYMYCKYIYAYTIKIDK